MTHVYVWHDSIVAEPRFWNCPTPCNQVIVWDTGWRRCIGCRHLQVSFRGRTTNCRALLRKMTCKDKASYASSPPCTFVMCLSVKDLIHVAWLNHVWYDSIVYIYVVCSNLEIASRPAITSYVWHDSFIYVTHHMLDTTHLYAWHDSFIRAPWSQNRPAPRKQILCVTWLIQILIHIWMTWLIRPLRPDFEMALRPAITYYGVATISRRLKIVGLFCKRAL